MLVPDPEWRPFDTTPLPSHKPSWHSLCDCIQVGDGSPCVGTRWQKTCALEGCKACQRAERNKTR